MTVKAWWLWALGGIGIAVVALLAVIAYALLRTDDRSESQGGRVISVTGTHAATTAAANTAGRAATTTPAYTATPAGVVISPTPRRDLVRRPVLPSPQITATTAPAETVAPQPTVVAQPTVVPTPAPPSTVVVTVAPTPAPTPKPTPIVTPTPTASAAYPKLGTYTGTTSQGKPVELDVVDSYAMGFRAIGRIRFDYEGVCGTNCSCEGNVETVYNIAPLQIVDSAFSKSVQEYDISGEFSSATAASGDLEYHHDSTGPSDPDCNSGPVTWTASHQ